jgi:hypothetical protein
MGIVSLKNLQAGFNFRVTLVGLNSSTIVKVQKVELPSAIQVEERVHFERGDKKILAGTTSRDGTLTLESVIPNNTADREYFNMLELMKGAISDIGNLPSTYMKSILIEELNELGVAIRRHSFTDCVLNKYELPSYDAGSSENAIEKLIFFVNGYNMPL